VPTQASVSPWWAAITIWIVVNLVNVLQGVGFLSRLPTGSLRVNHILGFVMIAMAAPAGAAGIALARAGAGARHWIGAAVYVAFILLLVAVEYIWPVEFRSPPRPGVLVPYLVLFFGAIVLMGIPMYRVNRSLWWVTAVTSVFLLIAMGIAMRKGVG